MVHRLDDTIEQCWGRRIRASGIYRDPVRSSDSHFVKASGLRRMSLMLHYPISLTGQVWVLPFLTALMPSERACREQSHRHKPGVTLAAHAPSLQTGSPPKRPPSPSLGSPTFSYLSARVAGNPLDQGKATAQIRCVLPPSRNGVSQPERDHQRGLHALARAEGLRRVAPFIAYLTEVGVLTYDRARLDACVEEDRIARMLDSAETPLIRLIRAYRDHLASRGRTLKTQRVSVSFTLALMTRLGDAPLHEFSQIHLRGTLRRQPGLAAALRGFLSFIAMHGGPDLNPAKPRRTDPVRHEKRILAKVRTWRTVLRNPRSEGHPRALMVSLIAHVYTVPLTRVLDLRRNEIGPGPTLWPDAEAIGLAEPLSSAFTRWAALDGDFAFPGRHGHQPLSESAVKYQLLNSMKQQLT